MIRDIEIRFTDNENKQINEQIQNFVREMENKGKGPSTNYYLKHRKAHKPNKDIFLGKKAEFIALRALKNLSKLFSAVEVDMEIRYRKAKGWKPDFSVGGINYHVKACSFSTKDYCGDYSWTFQIANTDIPAGRDELLNSDGNDYVVLVYMKEEISPEGIVKAILQWKEAKPLLRDPLKTSLIGLKKCLYYKDLKGGALGES